MKYIDDVQSGSKQPVFESNGGMKYVRWDFYSQEVETEGVTNIIWHFKEYQMTDDEYNDIRVGRYNGEWTDKLREIQRSYLYDIADVNIMKYSTDAYDNDKYEEWVEYKRNVRATPEQDLYPAEVTYPEEPE